MRNVDSKLPRQTYLGILITAVIVLILVVLVLIPPRLAEAVNVSVSPSSTIIAPGDSITFDVTVNILSNERIPIQSVYLRLYSDAGGSTELTGSPYDSPRVMSLISATPDSGWGYGSRYGYDPLVGQGYTFGYGYGYSGYGYGGGITLTYRCTITTSESWDSDTYYVRGDVNCGNGGSHTFSSTIDSFTVAYDWDVNTAGCINVLDAILVGQHWGETGTPGWIREDVNGDGTINVLDVILIGQNWGEGCG